MKYYFILYLTCITILSCNKEPENTKPPVQEEPDLVELGMTKAVRDGEVWSINLYANKYNDSHCLQLGGHGTRPYLGGIDETFSIQRIPLAIGKYPIVQHNPLAYLDCSGFCSARIGWIKHHDQSVGGLTSTDRHPEDFIEIIRFDTLKRTIQGRFQLTLLRTDPDQGWGLPDSTHMTDGVFHLKLIE